MEERRALRTLWGASEQSGRLFLCLTMHPRFGYGLEIGFEGGPSPLRGKVDRVGPLACVACVDCLSLFCLARTHPLAHTGLSVPDRVALGRRLRHISWLEPWGPLAPEAIAEFVEMVWGAVHEAEAKVARG